MRPPYFIPETKKVDELLAEFKRSKQHLAIVRALKAGDVDRAQRELTRNLATFSPNGRTA